MPHPKVKISDDTGNTVSVTGNKLDVNATIQAGDLNVGNVDIHLNGGVPLLGNAGDVEAGVLRVTLAGDDALLEDIPNVIGTDANTGPSKCISIGGTSQSNGHIQEIRVNNNGELMVDITSATTGASGATVPFKIDSVAYNTGDVGIMAKVVCSDTLATLTNVTNGEISSLQVDTQGALYTTHGVTGGGQGIKVTTGAGNHIVLGGDVACKKIDIQAQTDNTGLIAVGFNNVDVTEASGDGIILYAGDTYSLEVNNLNLIYIDSTVTGDGVRYTYFT